ncbi:putative F-box protein At4g22660 [Trifolium pratense]|uniref:putative F-box protein At4g22660 n=1 Tax=Trifolium pratense TaxID=57577 RepID=UPI001E698051|nr:putative F-box protein At4g22660 [Trifolium pratense]
MKHWVFFAASFMVLLSGCCCKFTKKREMKKRDEQVSKDEKQRNWSKIPTQILELILSRLSRADFYRFGEVCTSWRHVFKQSIIYRSPSPLPSMPLLLLYRLHLFNDIKTGLFSLIDRKMYFPRIPFFQGSNLHCLGSINGWLIMIDTNATRLSSSSSNSNHHRFPSFFFWNPIPNARVMLPSRINIPYRANWYKLFSKLKASSGPDSPDCLVAALFTGQHNIAFCRPHDESWNIIYVENNNPNAVFADIELLYGKCYVLTETLNYRNITSILVYDLQESYSSSSPPKAKVLISQLHQQVEYNSPNIRDLIFQNHQLFFYLASDSISGILYLILIIVDYNNVHPIEREFIVYKVDNFNNVPMLVRVMDLNGGILFLSHRDSKIVPSSTLTGHEDLIRGNNIYYAHVYPYTENCPLMPRIVKFCMTSGRINHIPLPNPELGSEPTCLWFNPTIW